MRDYGKVHSTFWTSPTTAPLSDDARMLGLYLLTCPHANALGCFRLPDGYVMEDLRWSKERVSKGFAELFRNGFANRCETTFWVLIPAHLKFNPPENPNQIKSISRLACQVPGNASIALDLKTVLEQHIKTADEPAKRDVLEAIKRLEVNPSETVPKPFRNQKQEQKQEQEQEQEGSAGPAATAPTTPIWDSYSQAYFARYGTEPTRNAKVNAQLKQFLKHVGVADAPHVAAHYVTNNSAFYVQRGHPIDCLVADYQKLLTEWKTGRTVTSIQARQIEQTASNTFARMAANAK